MTAIFLSFVKNCDTWAPTPKGSMKYCRTTTLHGNGRIVCYSCSYFNGLYRSDKGGTTKHRIVHPTKHKDQVRPPNKGGRDENTVHTW